MTYPDISLIAVFLTGLLGGVHCAGMCGGIVSALGMLQRKPLHRALNIPVRVESVQASVAVVGPAFIAVAAYNLGRILTYTMLGTMAGAIGSIAWLMQSMLPVQQTAFFLSNVLVVLMGLYVIGFKRIGSLVESWGKHLWQRIRPAATARLTGSGFLNSVLAGSLWGLVPCGLVYAVLSAALVSGGWLQGGMLMLAFGLGTLPNLMLLGLSGQWLARASRNHWVRLLAGSVIIVLGLRGLLHWSRMVAG